MDNQKSAMFSAALIGGAGAGVLSGIPIVSCLCCLWIIGGAMLAAYLLAKDSPVVLTAGDGAIVGVFTGIVAVVVQAIISFLFRPVNREFFRRMMERFAEYAEEMPPGFESFFEDGSTQTSVPLFLIGILVSAIVFAALGALGGIIGISLFGKKFLPSKTKGVIDVPKDTDDSQP
jgi:hypothetical protein